MLLGSFEAENVDLLKSYSFPACTKIRKMPVFIDYSPNHDCNW